MRGFLALVMKGKSKKTRVKEAENAKAYKMVDDFGVHFVFSLGLRQCIDSR